MRQETKDLIRAVLDGKKVQHRLNWDKVEPNRIPPRGSDAWRTFEAQDVAVRYLTMEYTASEFRLEPKPDVVRYAVVDFGYAIKEVALERARDSTAYEPVMVVYDGDTGVAKSIELIKE